jgi:hypothetical protein
MRLCFLLLFWQLGCFFRRCLDRLQSHLPLALKEQRRLCSQRQHVWPRVDLRRAVGSEELL